MKIKAFIIFLAIGCTSLIFFICLYNTSYQDNILQDESYSASSTQNEEFLNWIEDQKKIQMNIQSVCDKYGKLVHKIPVQSSDILYDEKSKFLMCGNSKAGTTTWLTHFLKFLDESTQKEIMSKNMDVNSLHEAIPKHFMIKDKEKNIRVLADSSYSFTTVRHPFQRLVSTFEDKFLHENYYYEEIGRNIQQKYGELTFKNFIQMILDDAGCRLESIGYCDNHWKTFLSKCGYCDVQYKYFVRSEHFQMDTEYIGMTTNTYFDSEAKNVRAGNKSEELTRKYFEELDRETIQKLYDRYKVDFEMFNYSIDI